MSETASEPTAEELQQSNGERLRHLEMRGISINVQALTMRHLFETLVPDPDERVRFELEFQRKLAAVLDSAEASADRMILEAQAQEAGGLIVPGSSSAVS